MLTPSYSEIMEVLNEDAGEEEQVVTSRYSVVIAAAKRARQIVSGAPCDARGAKTDKAVSIAISELGRGLIQILPEDRDESGDVWALPGGESAEEQYKLYYGAAGAETDEGGEFEATAGGGGKTAEAAGAEA
jgi:DNA-directed RNA polymerase subunit omega